MRRVSRVTAKISAWLRWSARWIGTPGGRLAGVVALGSMMLVGCGATGSSVAAECWKASDRIANSGDASYPQWKKPPEMTIHARKHYTATLTTNKGAFDVEFYPEDAPQTVNNFICLARAGYYNNTPFHRIVAGFVIQGGDPTGTGTGGPGYQFDDEPIKRNYEIGTLAMANSGPNTNGSQFFIVVGDQGTQLPKNYTIFGKVTSGMDVVNTIAQTPTRPSASGEVSLPVEPVTLQSVTIAESS
jgi:cyclophilin family peptidyl-prolyl cis-trans isomerase